VYILSNISSTYYLIINPILWIIVSIVVFLVNIKSSEKKLIKKTVIKSVLIVTLLYIIIYYLSGVVFGFLNTTYSHTFIGTVKNMFSILLVVLLREYVRYVLINNCYKNKIMYVLITILFIVINIDFITISKNFQDSSTLFEYISSYIVPKIAENILCTYLVLKGTNIASSIYIGTITLFYIIIPIIPDLNWFFSSIASLLVAFYIFVKVNYEIKNKERQLDKKSLRKQKPYKLIPFAVVIISGVCFVAGVFKYVPVAVLSNSMSPKFERGDACLIEKLNEEEKKYIKEGDIIEYIYKDKIIIHRVIKIIDTDKKNIMYTTKGDNNNASDPKLVKEEQILGKVKYIIPYIGYPSVFFSELILVTPPEDIRNLNSIF
jgi:signal peptidase